MYIIVAINAHSFSCVLVSCLLLKTSCEFLSTSKRCVEKVLLGFDCINTGCAAQLIHALSIIIRLKSCCS